MIPDRLLRDFSGQSAISEKDLCEYATEIAMYLCSGPHGAAGPVVAIGIDHRGHPELKQGNVHEFLISGDSRIGYAARVILSDIDEHLIMVMVTTETGSLYSRAVLRLWDERMGEFKGYPEGWVGVPWGQRESVEMKAHRLRMLLAYQEELEQTGGSGEELRHVKIGIESLVNSMDRALGRNPI